MVQIGGLSACRGPLVGIFWCAYKFRARQPKRQLQRPTFRPSQEQKPFEYSMGQEDLNSRNGLFSHFPWLARLSGPSRGHEYLQRIL